MTTRTTPQEARAILSKLSSDDFHALRHSEVSELCAELKKRNYRKSRYAPGSTARMFFQHLTRIANRKD